MVMGYQCWHHQWHYCTCLVKIIKIRCNVFLVMWYILYWHWHHVMLMVFSIVQLHVSSRWWKWGAIQWHFGHFMQLALAQPLHDATGINGSIAFLMTRQIKWCNMTFWSFDPTGTDTSLTWCQQHHQWHHSLPKCNTIKSGSLWLLSCDAIGISTGITWCHLHWC